MEKKKHIKKRLFTFLSFVLFTFILSGCLYTETVPMDITTPNLMVDGLDGNSITFEHKIGDSIIETSYYTGDYLMENWKITDTKTIMIKAGVKELEEGTELLVEHMHADISIKSEDPQLNGLTQDSMDNSYHGTSQDGFLINEKYSYSNIFAIEGFSKDLISGWGFYTGSYGTSDVSSKRLTEESIFKARTYGSQLTVIFNILVKNSGDDKYYVESFEDRIIIPTSMYINAVKELERQQAATEEQQDEGTN